MNNGHFIVSCGKCHKWFRYNDMIPKKRMVYNIEITEKCCPFCGNKGITAKKHEKYLKKFEQTNDVY